MQPTQPAEPNDMPHCAIRTQDGDGPWRPCPEPVYMTDFDGDRLCATHLQKLWFCECGRFNVAGNVTLCALCQAEEQRLYD